MSETRIERLKRLYSKKFLMEGADPRVGIPLYNAFPALLAVVEAAKPFSDAFYIRRDWAEKGYPLLSGSGIPISCKDHVVLHDALAELEKEAKG